MAEKEYIERGALMRKECPMRHENGNCLPCGGFCTAVIDPICEAMHNAYYMGKKPAANVVEVVRCKECNHRDKKGICEKFRQRYPFFPEDDFYCGFGAKMDGKGGAV